MAKKKRRQASQRKRVAKARPRKKKAQEAPAASPSPEKKLTGFARLSPEQRAALGARGGTAAAISGKAHRWKPGEEASEAGKRGAASRAAAKDTGEAEAE